MALNLPLRPDLTHYDMQVSLDGVVYTLEFRWNTRDAAWYLYIQTEAGDPIISGIKVLVDTPLGARSRDPRKPKGVLLAADSTKRSLDPQVIADLGDRVYLLYIPVEELPNG